MDISGLGEVAFIDGEFEESEIDSDYGFLQDSEV